MVRAPSGAPRRGAGRWPLNGQRRVKVRALPLGIPVDYFEALAKSERVRERAARIKRALRTPHVILGVDRLDYTKGICERILGFERFLEDNPNFRRQVIDTAPRFWTTFVRASQIPKAMLPYESLETVPAVRIQFAPASESSVCGILSLADPKTIGRAFEPGERDGTNDKR